jgi:hypothetical protein
MLFNGLVEKTKAILRRIAFICMSAVMLVICFGLTDYVKVTKSFSETAI